MYKLDGQNQYQTGNFCFTAMQTFKVGRYCLPMEPEGKNTVDNLLMSTESVFRRIVGDLALVIILLVYWVDKGSNLHLLRCNGDPGADKHAYNVLLLWNSSLVLIFSYYHLNLSFEHGVFLLL